MKRSQRGIIRTLPAEPSVQIKPPDASRGTLIVSIDFLFEHMLVSPLRVRISDPPPLHTSNGRRSV